ncbi:probable plastidic glucose transporter 1 isoform X1 [Nymphaea colorata]|nr:probable plastidic glucose transporter 1 isoform X1 [Nymphaea colorata]XP_031479120.1 probable plastidic glucose transporter 1 isoform X1 [Nymphaea colorata]
MKMGWMPTVAAIPAAAAVFPVTSSACFSFFVPKYVPSKLQCGASAFHLPRPRARVLGLWRKSRPRVPRNSINDEVPAPDDDPDVRISGGSVAPSGEGSTGLVDLGWLPAFPHVLTASMANFLFGYHIGVMNGPIVSVARDLGFEGNSILEGLVVSIFIVGAFIGSIGSGYLVDNFGCRRTFQINAVPLIAGALLCAQAHSLDEILWGRFSVGLGIGANTVLVPIYISEVSPTRYRGSLGTICQIGTCLGIIASLLLGIPSDSTPDWWRTMLFIASIPAVIVMFGMQFAVESPRWLCKAGKWDDAKMVVSRIWGESQVDNAMKEIRSVVNLDGSDIEADWLELLQEPHNKVAFIGGMLFVLQQFAGINGVLYFSSLTFHDVGITNNALASLLVGLTNFAGALFALYLMDKQGRQNLIIGSYLGMAAAMFLIVFAVDFPVDDQLSHTLSILGTVMYVFTFALGAGPVTGLIIPELSSNRTRGKTMAFSFSVHWVCNFIVGLFFLDMVEKFGIGPVYASFGAVSVAAALFSKVFIIETKGRSLEEIELSLKANLSPRDE